MTTACHSPQEQQIETNWLSHREHEFGKGQATHWSDALACWCVFDPEKVKRLLEDESIHVVAYAGQLEPIAQKAHIDMGGVLRVLEHIPLANEQEQHLRSRRELSRLNNATRTPADWKD